MTHRFTSRLRSRTHRALHHPEDTTHCGDRLGHHGLGEPWCTTLPQMPQLRLGCFGFQDSALADWPTGGLRFGLRFGLRDRRRQAK